MKAMTRVKALLAAAIVMAGFAAFAQPSVEITKLEFANPLSGKASISYAVAGIEGDAVYDLSLKISAKGVKPAYIGIWNVGNGTSTTNVNYQALLGKCYPNVSVFAKLVKSHPSVQLWENGPYFASCNVGAEEPEEYGYYFWWGDTVGYVRNDANTGWNAVDGSKTGFSFSGVPTHNKNLQTLQDEGYVDETGTLLPDHDAAQAHWGTLWRMPTKEELNTLYDSPLCMHKEIVLNNVTGWEISGVGDYADKHIFLPMAGYGSETYYYNPSHKPILGEVIGDYWSSAASTSNATTAYRLFISNKTPNRVDDYARSKGFPVRPVHTTP